MQPFTANDVRSAFLTRQYDIEDIPTDDASAYERDVEDHKRGQAVLTDANLVSSSRAVYAGQGTIERLTRQLPANPASPVVVLDAEYIAMKPAVRVAALYPRDN